MVRLNCRIIEKHFSRVRENLRCPGSPGLSHNANMASRRLFVTTALPYANAPFHIGHMMEYIQADIWVRFQRMQGHEVHFMGADDAHGAPIMLAAEAAGESPPLLSLRLSMGRNDELDGIRDGIA